MFYDTFKSLCKEKGVTIKQAAKDLGINRTTVFKWKEHTPYNKKLQAIASYFGVSTIYLLTGEEKENATTQADDGTAELIALWGRLPKDKQELLLSAIRGFLKD